MNSIFYNSMQKISGPLFNIMRCFPADCKLCNCTALNARGVISAQFTFASLCFPEGKGVGPIPYSDGSLCHISAWPEGLQNPPLYSPEDLCNIWLCQFQRQGLAAFGTEASHREVSLHRWFNGFPLWFMEYSLHLQIFKKDFLVNVA